MCILYQWNLLAKLALHMYEVFFAVIRTVLVTSLLKSKTEFDYENQGLKTAWNLKKWKIFISNNQEDIVMIATW